MEKNTQKAKNNQETIKKNKDKRLANLKPQKAGEPGHNPKGRPLGSRNRKNIIQELLDMDAPESLLAEVRKLNPNAKTLRDIHTVSTFNRSLKGNPKAMEMMMYYDIGKPIENIDANMNINNMNIEYTKEERKEFLRKYLSDRTDS